MLKYWAGVYGRWVGAAAHGSLVNSRWVSSGYGRWVGGTFSDSPCLCMGHRLSAR